MAPTRIGRGALEHDNDLPLQYSAVRAPLSAPPRWACAMSSALRFQRWSVHDRLAIDDVAASLRAAGGAGVVALDRIELLKLPDDPTDLERARALRQHRQLRTAAFSPVRRLFHDPAWDLILGLFIAHEEGVPVTIGEAAMLAGLKADAGERWVRALQEEGLVKDWPSEDATAVRSIGLTSQAVAMMVGFLADT